MFKLFKMLKPNAILIIISIILVSFTGIASLMLPDRMSKIIGEGITTEVQYETTADGQPIYLNMGTGKIQLPKFVYKDAGILVVNQDIDGDYIANIAMNFEEEAPYLYYKELDASGNVVNLVLPVNGEITLIPMPVIIRTVDGNVASPRMQGNVVLDDAGTPQVVKIQVSHLDVIWHNGLIMILITLASTVASIGVAYLSAKVGMHFGRDVRNRLFKKTINFSQEEEDKFGTASLITRTTNDVTQVQMIVIMALRMMLVVPVMFIGGMIMAFSKDPQMTAVLFVSAPLVLIIIALVASKIIPMFKQMQKKIDNLTLVARENITGIRVIRAFGQDERENKRFNFANNQVTSLATKTARIMSVMFPLMQLIMSMTAISVMIIAVNTINKGLQIGTINFQSLGNMMAVIQYMMQIMMSIVMFSIIFIMVPRASVSANRINEVLDTVNNIKNPENPVQNINSIGSLQFKNVSFAFPKASSNVLSDITFEVNKGETTAIVGSTGSGKSTLINLIPRLYDVTDGEITVDGVNVKDYKLEDLRAKIGFVSQKAILFQGTISENISYGKSDATDEEIIEAAKIAQVDDFIESVSEKYDYKIEQGGANLSGGQKQRLAIARAICRRPAIYIFDDSFSALDFKTDMKLRKALNKITEDSTVLIVAQRIGTIMHADRIIVMQEGKVVGIGKHKQLLKTCEVYREIAESQLSEEELKRGGVDLNTERGAL